MTESNHQPPQSEIDSIIALFSNNMLQEALDEVKSLTKRFPKDSLLHNITGACYAGLGQLGSAIKCYDKAIDINPDYAKAHFNLGNALHDLTIQGIGHLDDPIKSYQRSIEIDPNYAEAHNNLGNVLKDLGRLDEAYESFEKALTIRSDYVEAHYSLGIVLFDLGQLDKAVQSYQKAIEINPKFAQAHNNLGNVFTEKGVIDEAILHYQKALELNPGNSETYNNLGNIYIDTGQFDDAVNAYKKALEINPNYPALYNNLGNAYKALRQLDKAAKSYMKGLSINPEYIDLLNNLGVVFNELGQFDEAVKSYKKAIAIKPDYSDAYNNLGVSYNKLGQLEQAIKAFEQALSISPEFPDPYNNLTVVYRKQGLINDVIICFKKAIEIMTKSLVINPGDSDVHNNLGIAYSEIEKLDEAVKSYQNAVEINPEFADAHNNLGVVLERLKQYEDAIMSFEKACLINPNIDYILGNILGAKMNSCDWDNLSNLLNNASNTIIKNKKVVDPFNLMAWIDDPALQRKATEIRVNNDYPKSHILPSINKYTKHSKIRIGYFSPDFREHPVGFLTAGLYELHNRDQFEIYAFSFGVDTKDKLNLRIKEGVDHYYDVDLMSHIEIVTLTRSLEIDIAVDLAGLTAESRTELFAISVAPIQLSYIGFLGTMGADYYDYLIADPVMIPKENQKYYAEKIVYLPSFQVNDSTDLPPEISLTRKEVGLPEEGFVFCCFNNTYKFTPQVFDSWARILKSVKDSVLIIYANNDLSKTNLNKEIENRGVKAERLILGKSIPKPEYLARYRTADLFLDTHPYNAGTTASDALKMGLPMITYLGKSYQARMGASIISALNLPELITNSPEEYEALAIELATNPEKLKAIKDKLKSNLSSAPLFDTPLFTKNIESAYTKMYERYHEGLEPDHIYVE